MKDFEQWHGFKGSKWRDDINTRDFILNNYTPYDGDESPLRGSDGAATNKLWGQSCKSFRKRNAPKAAFWIWIHTL